MPISSCMCITILAYFVFCLEAHFPFARTTLTTSMAKHYRLSGYSLLPLSSPLILTTLFVSPHPTPQERWQLCTRIWNLRFPIILTGKHLLQSLDTILQSFRYMISIINFPLPPQISQIGPSFWESRGVVEDDEALDGEFHGYDSGGIVYRWRGFGTSSIS